MRKFMAKSLFLLTFLGFLGSLQAQDILDTIFVKNASFEQNALSVYGWTDCSFVGETPFDPQPNHFKCTLDAADGKGYIGMVVRDNLSYESVTQMLSKPLERGMCYGFSLKLARSKAYISQSRTTGKIAHYTTPVRIRIWGANRQCGRDEMLAETGVIINHSWKTYYFKLEPIRNYQYIIIEAFYKTPSLFPYNGNVLVDDMTNIYGMKCDVSVKDVIAAVEKDEPVEKVEPFFPKPKVDSKPKVDTAKKVLVKSDPPTKKTILPELNRRVKKGQVLRIRNLSFKANSAELPHECTPVLDELYHFMLENSTTIIELGGHTNNRCDTEYCRKLSEKRAKAVADRLIAKGISKDRVTYKGYGKTKPVATNTTPSGRQKNQRVEVKFL